MKLERIKKYKNILYACIITILIEIFLCNFGFFRTLFVEKNIYPKFSVNENLIIISDIDSRVTSINFEYNSRLTDKITYKVSYIAEDNSDKIALSPKIILKNNKQYINFDTHAKCKTIEVEILTESNSYLKSVVLNHPNFNISIVRILLVFCGVIFIIQVKNKKNYEIEYDSNSKIHNIFFIINLFAVYIIIVLYTIFQFNSDSFLIKNDNIDRTDSILMQTEAIMNGQIELMEEPTDELKNMANPYDSKKRDEQGIYYLYDVAYFKGNYYNYFGIAPILTSILPFRIITGLYTHTYIFNLFYIFIVIFSLYFLYKKLLKLYVKKISLFNFYLGYYSILFASNIFTLLRGEKYDIVVTSGIAFLLLSLNLIISVYNNKNNRFLKLIILGITTSLIVLSKPNFIVYYLLIFFFYLVGTKNLEKKEKLIDALCIMIPLAIFAIFQMILNYLRFDNIFEFGAKYQLTGFNMITCMSVTFGKIYAGIVEYIFRTPSINPLKFPFVFINTDTYLTSINEVCYENRLFGLIAIPVLYGYFLKREIIKNKELNLFINLCLITAFFSIIICSCFGGICEAYCIDAKLILSIGAVIILLKWLENKDKYDDINKIFLILCITTIILMVPIGLTTEKNFLTNMTSDLTVYLKNIFEFWC